MLPELAVFSLNLLLQFAAEVLRLNSRRHTNAKHTKAAVIARMRIVSVGEL